MNFFIFIVKNYRFNRKIYEINLSELRFLICTYLTPLDMIIDMDKKS